MRGFGDSGRIGATGARDSDKGGVHLVRACCKEEVECCVELQAGRGRMVIIVYTNDHSGFVVLAQETKFCTLNRASRVMGALRVNGCCTDCTLLHDLMRRGYTRQRLSNVPPPQTLGSIEY